MGVFFVKKWKMGGCVKSGPFLNAWCIMYSISIFYFIFYLFGGAYAPNAPPAYGPEPLVWFLISLGWELPNLK